jgi:flavin-dependent dehydrogenase
MLLAQQGAKVLLVDRSRFPSGIPHGHFIHKDGPPRLKRWGLLDRIAELAPAVTEAVTDFGDFPLVSRNLSVNGIAWGYGPRRSLLDEVLVDAAIEAGAEFRDGFNVEECLFDEGRLIGMKGRAREGGEIEERAALVIGADGRNSRLARTVQAPAYDVTPALLCYYFSYWSGVDMAGFELYVNRERHRALFAHKTSDGLVAVFAAFPVQDLVAVRADIGKAFMESLDLFPDFSERVRLGTREERFYGATDLMNFYRKPFGPGWALVGDAGFHKDPWLALGISDALRDAELLAEAVGDGLSGRRAIGDAMRDYECRRNQHSSSDYAEDLAMASFAPWPDFLLPLRSAIRDNPEECRRFMMARVGMIPPQEFFNPENLERLLGAPQITLA